MAQNGSKPISAAGSSSRFRCAAWNSFITCIQWACDLLRLDIYYPYSTQGLLILKKIMTINCIPSTPIWRRLCFSTNLNDCQGYSVEHDIRTVFLHDLDLLS
jgi:hypothetical protein